MTFPGKRRLALLAAPVASAVAIGGVAVATADHRAARDDRGGRSDSDSRELRRAIDGGKARNVILLIGDGMAQSEITIARNYEKGAGGTFRGLDRLTFTGDKTTYSVQESNPELPDYDPDSASTGTAWSTGSKTSDGRISTLPGQNEPGDEPETILELAEEAGLRTGNVSTARLTDATPAAPMAHINLRGCEGPEDMGDCPAYRKSAGGPGSISEQSIEQGIEVLLGGGADKYDVATDAGPTVTELAEDAGYEVVRTESELGDVRRGPVLGLFQSGHMQPEWTGLPATNPPSGTPDGQVCNEDNPDRLSTEPDLDEMTESAIELLDRKQRGHRKRHRSHRGHRSHKRKRGFFLQVESALIDKRNHAAQPCEQIGDTVAFDRAVREALRFARRDGRTLVIVTGDHAHTSQIVSAGSNPPGCSSLLETKEGAPMMVTYGTAAPCPTADGEPGASQQHTGSQMRIAAEGPRAASFVGLGDDTETFEVMARALGLR